LFSVAPAIASDGTLTYTTATDAFGVATIEVTASDGIATTAPTTFTILLVPVASPPTARDTTVHTNEDQPVVITLTATDPDGDDLTFEINQDPQHGTVGPLTDNVSTAEVTY